jgi:hypothetical protein
MKKVLGILLAVFLCLGIASTSMAFGGVETCKEVTIFAKASLCTHTAAESDAISLQGNIATFDGSSYSHPHGNIFRPTSSAVIKDSANKNSGILGVNDASGNFNNQGNTAAVTSAGFESDRQTASDRGEGSRPGRRGHRGPRGALAHAVAFAFQGNAINGYMSAKKEVTARIEGSVSDNSGIAGVNNAGGSQNNQANTVAVAAGLNTSIALGEATLAQANALGFVCITAGFNDARIDNSINNNSGIVGVNNSAGVQNNQANVVAVAGNQ